MKRTKKKTKQKRLVFFFNRLANGNLIPTTMTNKENTEYSYLYFFVFEQDKHYMKHTRTSLLTQKTRTK